MYIYIKEHLTIWNTCITLPYALQHQLSIGTHYDGKLPNCPTGQCTFPLCFVPGVTTLQILPPWPGVHALTFVSLCTSLFPTVIIYLHVFSFTFFLLFSFLTYLSHSFLPKTTVFILYCVPNVLTLYKHIALLHYIAILIQYTSSMGSGPWVSTHNLGDISLASL